jgi:hypothetical protein
VTEHDIGTETRDTADINFLIVRGMIFGGALAVTGGLLALLVAIVLTID